MAAPASAPLAARDLHPHVRGEALARRALDPATGRLFYRIRRARTLDREHHQRGRLCR
jgi:hypothetical protein